VAWGGHGDRAYPAYPEAPGAERTRWLVRVPRHVAVPLLRSAEISAGVGTERFAAFQPVTRRS
jgi:hypothetical protein